jgi:hypothetical protein
MAATEKRGWRRLPTGRTWLGAGVLAVGLSAAAATGSAVAQADTGNHSAASSASASKPDAQPSAGSKRARGVAETAARTRLGVSSTVAARSSRASVKPAAARPAAGIVAPTTLTRDASASVKTPLGPITVALSATIPIPYTNGPVALNLKATTPFGNAEGSLAGSQKVTAGLPPVNELSLVDGNLVTPAQVAFLASAAGPAVTGGLSLSNSATSFTAAARSGNVIGALQALLSAAPNFANAVLFGRQTVTVPLVSSVNDEPQSVELQIPFGGWFAPLQPVSVSWSDYTYVDETGVSYKVDAGDLDFEGTKFGGAVPALFALFRP